MTLANDLDPLFLWSTQFRIALDSNTLALKSQKNWVQFSYWISWLNWTNSRKTEKWTLPLSLIRQVNAIKMVLLMRFLYLFQNIPVFIPKSFFFFFKLLDSIIMPFVWVYKTHWKATFKNQGNVGPESAVFFALLWAANVSVMVYWQYGFERVDRFIPPPWLAIEKSLTSKTSLPALLSSSPKALRSLQEWSFCFVKYSEDLQSN